MQQDRFPLLLTKAFKGRFLRHHPWEAKSHFHSETANAQWRPKTVTKVLRSTFLLSPPKQVFSTDSKNNLDQAQPQPDSCWRLLEFCNRTRTPSLLTLQWNHLNNLQPVNKELKCSSKAKAEFTPIEFLCFANKLFHKPARLNIFNLGFRYSIYSWQPLSYVLKELLLQFQL